MSKRIRSVVGTLFVVFVVMGVGERNVEAGGVYATEWTQIMNNVQLANVDVQTLQSLAQQIRQTQTMLQQAKTLDVTLFSDVFGEIKAAEDVVKSGQGLAYTMANMDSEWNLRFHEAGYTDMQNYPKLYNQWAATSLDSVRGTMNATTAQGKQFQSDADMVRKLQEQAKSGVAGSLQAEQMLAEICSQMLGEMQKLRQLMLADLQSKEAWQAQQIQEGMASHDLVKPDKLFQVYDSGNLKYDNRKWPDDYFNGVMNKQ